MRYPKLRELKEAIRALIKGPYTSKFPYEPHQPFERFRGKPEFYEKDCIGCTACAQVCPSGAITFKDEVKDGGAVRSLNYRMDLCIFCGQCQANCPTEKGIMLSREFDLATTERREDLGQSIEKEMILCECCGKTVVPKDQYLWVADRLGPLMFSNPSLFLSYLTKMPLTKITPKEKSSKLDKEFRRQDRFKVLCPKCRREAVLKS